MNKTILNKEIGQRGEKAVGEWLKQNGYEIKCFNFVTRFGEIDIIAYKKPILACIEVKTRSNPAFPISSVITLSKQRKIITSLKLFLSQLPMSEEMVCRFDVATVVYENNNFMIEYIENAFTE